jgi:dsRNA-specific ribonuclease
VPIHENSIGILQELCAKQSYSLPVYTDTNRSGEDHEPIFTVQCVVTINGRQSTAEGKASSKKSAKNMSAQEMVKLLRNGSYHNEDPVPKVPTSVKNGFKVEVFDEHKPEDCGQYEDNVNSIGYLQEMCSKRHFQPPVYTETKRTGIAHQPRFTIQCQLTINGHELVTESAALTKKLA